MFFGHVVDLGSCRFWAEAEHTCIFMWFLLFFNEMWKSLRSKFSQMLIAVSLATRSPKRAILIGNFQGFLTCRKKYLVARPLIFRGGGTQPQENQKGPNPCIFTVFSCLAQNQKKGPRLRLSRGQVGNFLEPQVTRRGILPAFLQSFLILNKKNMHFYTVLGLWDTCREQPGTQRERKKHNFTCIFAGFWCLG